jgi:CelD/BcsL family acetyltransferase involved in cellulose biosynthesis
MKKVPEEPLLLRRWNELVVQMERPQVFYTCEWALAVQSAYHAALKPLLFLGYDEDDLVAVASLATDASGDEVSFLAANTADYCEFLCHPQRRAEFVEAIFDRLKQLKMGTLKLANLPADSATPNALRTAGKKYGFHVHLRPAYSCPQVELGSAAQRQEFKTMVKGKRQLRRCLRALEREGPVTATYLHSWNEIQAALPAFFEAHVARFQARQRTSFLETGERQLFMEDLAKRLSDSGIVTFSSFKIADRPVAWSFGFQFHEGWFLYQTTFDIRCEENSPGYCLLAKILIEACDMSSMARVDLGLGAEGYKEWFANSARQTLYAAVTASTVRHWREITRYRIATEVKRSPRLEAAIRNGLSRLGL